MSDNNTTPHTANCTPPNTRNPSSIDNIHAARSLQKQQRQLQLAPCSTRKQAFYLRQSGSTTNHTASQIPAPPLIQTEPSTKPAHNKQHPSSAHKLSSSTSSLEHHVHTCIQTRSSANAVCLRPARHGHLTSIACCCSACRALRHNSRIHTIAMG
jgi:hypothetical protein